MLTALVPWIRWGIWTGIATAVCLAVVQFSFLGNDTLSAAQPQGDIAPRVGKAQEDMGRWRRQAEFLVQRYEQPHAAVLLHRILQATSPVATLRNVSLDTGAVTRVALEAEIAASSAEVFELRLRTLLDGLGALDPRLKEMPTRTVNFQPVAGQGAEPTRYRFHLDMEVPCENAG
jgi:hypothetical protein